MANVTFGIPLISERVTRDWSATKRLLANTLGSVFNQSHADIHVIIACHEAPDIAEVRDPRVTLAPVGFDIPRFRWEQEIDRMRKLEVIGAEHRKRGGGWLFILDADDLIGSGLAAKIADTTAKAFIQRNGYRLDAKRRLAQNMNRLWRKCGSCVAVDWRTEELPLVPLADNPPVFHEFAETRHYQLAEFFEKRGWSFVFNERPDVVYLINHGQNQSELIVHDNLRWRLYFKLAQWKPWTAALDSAFGIKESAFNDAVYRGNAKFSTEEA